MDVGIPWRDSGDPYRARNAKFVIQWYGIMGYGVTLGDDTKYEEFNRAAARNACISQAEDIAITADMDIVLERPSDLWRAANMAKKYDRLVIPIYELYWLDEKFSELFMDGRTIDKSNLTPELYVGGGIHIIPKRLHDIMGGYDERYVGYGLEDIDYYIRHNKMFGEYIRTKAVAYHLWHPTSTPNPVNQKRFNRRKFDKHYTIGQLMEWEE